MENLAKLHQKTEGQRGSEYLSNKDYNFIPQGMKLAENAEIFKKNCKAKSGFNKV